MTTLTTKGVKGLARQIRARFTNGKTEPLAEVDFKEGDEVIITLKETPSPKTANGAFERAAGGWKGLVDTDALLRDFKKSREIISPEVRL